MAGNHSHQMACGLGMALQPKAKRQCEQPHSGGANPSSRTANTANPTSALHAWPAGPFLDSSGCFEEHLEVTGFHLQTRGSGERVVPAGCSISLGPWASLCFTGIVGRRGCQRHYLPHTKESCLWMERFAFSLHGLRHGLQS